MDIKEVLGKMELDRDARKRMAIDEVCETICRMYLNLEPVIGEQAATTIVSERVKTMIEQSGE